VGTVARVFALHEPSFTRKLENDDPRDEDKVSEPAGSAERGEAEYSQLQPSSLEETRRQARVNWLRSRQQTITGQKDIAQERNCYRGVKGERGQSQDPELDD